MDLHDIALEVIFEASCKLLGNEELLKTICHGGATDHKFCHWPKHIIVYLRFGVLYHHLPWEQIVIDVKLKMLDNAHPIGYIELIEEYELKKLILGMRHDLVEKMKNQ